MINKKQSATDIKDLILDIIKDNFSNPNFSVQSLTSKLRISVGYLPGLDWVNLGYILEKNSGKINRHVKK